MWTIFICIKSVEHTPRLKSLDSRDPLGFSCVQSNLDFNLLTVNITERRDICVIGDVFNQFSAMCYNTKYTLLSPLVICHQTS